MRFYIAILLCFLVGCASTKKEQKDVQLKEEAIVAAKVLLVQPSKILGKSGLIIEAKARVAFLRYVEAQNLNHCLSNPDEYDLLSECLQRHNEKVQSTIEENIKNDLQFQRYLIKIKEAELD